MVMWQVVRPIALSDFRTRYPLLEVDPDAGITTAVERSARHGAALPDAAAHGLFLEMDAVPVSILGDHVRLLEVPADDRLAHILLRLGERQSAAGGAA